MQHQTQIKRFTGNKEYDQDLEDFKKKHSSTFMYFLEEYHKWVQIKNKTNSETNE